jgi:hypothetical protein
MLSAPQRSLGGKRKKYVKHACKPCINAKRSCTDHRPCDRCVRLGRVAECLEGADSGDAGALRHSEVRH